MMETFLARPVSGKMPESAGHHCQGTAQVTHHSVHPRRNVASRFSPIESVPSSPAWASPLSLSHTTPYLSSLYSRDRGPANSIVEEMGRRCRAVLLSFLLFSVLVPESIVRAVTIPPRFDGFPYNYNGTLSDSVVIEAFFDPVCPDSRDAWQPIKRAVAYYAPHVALIVHPFPLPWVFLSLFLLFWEISGQPNIGFRFRLLLVALFCAEVALFFPLDLIYIHIWRIWESVAYLSAIHENFEVFFLEFRSNLMEKTQPFFPSVDINFILLWWKNLTGRQS